MELREKLSELEHIQWEHWSKSLTKEIEKIYQLTIPVIGNNKMNEIRKIVSDRIVRWKINWVSYSELPEEVKDYDREWADKVLEIPEIAKALAFVNHLKNHPEVISAPVNAGIPMCKICNKTIDEIYLQIIKTKWK